MDIVDRLTRYRLDDYGTLIIRCRTIEEFEIIMNKFSRHKKSYADICGMYAEEKEDTCIRLRKYSEDSKLSIGLGYADYDYYMDERDWVDNIKKVVPIIEFNQLIL